MPHRRPPTDPADRDVPHFHQAQSLSQPKSQALCSSSHSSKQVSPKAGQGKAKAREMKRGPSPVQGGDAVAGRLVPPQKVREGTEARSCPAGMLTGSQGEAAKAPVCSCMNGYTQGESHLGSVGIATPEEARPVKRLSVPTRDLTCGFVEHLDRSCERGPMTRILAQRVGFGSQSTSLEFIRTRSSGSLDWLLESFRNPAHDCLLRAPGKSATGPSCRSHPRKYNGLIHALWAILDLPNGLDAGPARSSLSGCRGTGNPRR